MSVNTATPDGGRSETEELQAIYGRIADILDDISVSEHPDRYIELQRAYFGAKAALLARDEEFQSMDLSGRDVAVPSSHTPETNPTVTDENGEWEVPTRTDSYRVLDAIGVARPKNPHTTHTVTIDHRITQDGEVIPEVNAHELPDLPPSDDSRAPW